MTPLVGEVCSFVFGRSIETVVGTSSVNESLFTHRRASKVWVDMLRHGLGVAAAAVVAADALRS